MGPRGTSRPTKRPQRRRPMRWGRFFEQLRNEARQRVAGPSYKNRNSTLRATRPMF